MKLLFNKYLIAMDIVIGHNNIQIKNSYQIKKNQFDELILNMHRECPNHPVLFNRSTSSIKKEIATHNFFYKLGILRSRTKDTDVNYPVGKLWLFAYYIIGSIGWLFID